LKIVIAVPAPVGSLVGNRLTAERWAAHMRAVGHDARLIEQYRGESADVLFALHARRSAESIDAWAALPQAGRLVVVMTGTDLYVDTPAHERVARSLELADRIVVLQPSGVSELPAELQTKARVLVQSAPAVAAAEPATDAFEVCVIGHLREVKDPFLAASASRLLAPDSRVRIVHIGAALEEGMAQEANREERENPRYHWLGEQSHDDCLACLARARASVLSSRAEGGAHAVLEAIATRTPLLASRIPGNVGLLGDDYPAYFEVGDVIGLAALLTRVEGDAEFRAELVSALEERSGLADPGREQADLGALLAELEDELKTIR